MSVLLFLALAVLVCNLWAFSEVALGLGRMRQLQNISPLAQGAPVLPRVSIIVPACNEEQTIAPALQTLISQDYENLEILVINDRSTDRTGELLARIQERYPHLRIITITELPEGWLGKSHAMQAGADQATGEILLFTDADIMMESSSVARAVAVLESERLDHLCLIFQNVARGWLLNGMILDAASGLLALFKPWRVRDERSRYFMGVGAFNMVRAEVYSQCSGHRRIRMHPIDDIMLGKIIKQQGFRQDCLLGYGLVVVEWYPGASEMINGLMKNVFAVAHYRAWLSLAGIMIIFAIAILPFWGALLATGMARLFFVLTVIARLFAFTFGAVVTSMPLATVAGSLFSPYISIFIVARATWLTLKNKGIIWRGSHYELEELRKSEPLLF